MTVDELRKALEGLPSDMPVLTYDHGYLSAEFVSAEVKECILSNSDGADECHGHQLPSLKTTPCLVIS
jgi:hypothetical protein